MGKNLFNLAYKNYINFGFGKGKSFFVVFRNEYFFEAQLSIAEEKQLPVVIHSVRATGEVIQQLRKRPSLTGMIHSYSGSYEQALQLIELGFYLSFGGAITYTRAHKLRNMVSKLPLSALLIETDAPDQPDATHTHQRNEPAYLNEVLTALSHLKHEQASVIAQHAISNTQTLFKLT